MATKVYKPYLTSGQVYLRDADDPAAPMLPVGNCSALTLSAEEEVIEQQDFTTPGGGTYAEVRRIKGVKVNMTLHDFNRENIARATKGTVTGVAAGTITAEPHTAHKGALIRLAHPSPSSVAVKNGATTYVAGTDYEVRGEGVFVTESSNIPDATAVTVDYAHAEYDVVEALTSSGKNWHLSFGGMNEADSDKPVVLDVWKLSLGGANELSMIGTDMGELAFEGKCLADTTKGTGSSKFYRQQYV